MARKEEPKIVPNNDLEKKIMESFEVFDHSGKQVVDVREIGTILRSLGCCPTEAEVQEVILATENKEATGNVPLVNFLPYMCKAIIEHRYYPASAEMLLAAFRYFDTENRGYLTKERFSQLMLEEGEPFTQEEYDEMMQTALDPVTDTITYEYYINQLMIEKVAHTNNLGVIVDQRLSWYNQVELAMNRVRKLIWVLKTLRHVTTKELLKKIYIALAQSVLMY